MMAKLEILSDEVLLQFFQYLDAYHLFTAFFNLNLRFNQLIKDSLLYLKFNSKYVRSINTIDSDMWYTMVNHLTAVTLINHIHSQVFLSVFNQRNLINLQSLTLLQVYIDRDRSPIVWYISNLKSLKNLRVQAIGHINALSFMIFLHNGLPELKSFECTSRGYSTNAVFMSGPITNIESLTIRCIYFSLKYLLSQTPKLRYLNINLRNNRPQLPIGATLLPLPTMMYLTDLKMKIHAVSYKALYEIMKCMPYLESLELSGSTLSQNLDNGHQLKILFGHIPYVQLDNLKCPTTATSKNTILSTFHDDIDKFWSDVTCSIINGKAYLSAVGYIEDKLQLKDLNLV